LARLIGTGIAKDGTLTLVEQNDTGTHLHLTVVAAPLEGVRGRKWIVASSVVTLATKDGIDEFGTHDVIAGPELESVAQRAAFLMSFKLRVSRGLVK
jgi:hypothetical protein